MKKILSVLLIFSLIFTLIPKQEVSASGFTDVKSSHGFYGEIMFLLDKGVIAIGTSFGVDQKVTREEVAVMVSKAIGLSGGNTNTPFKDVPSTLASSGYIKSAVDAGVLSGYTDGTFRPKEIVNRGQMAIFLANAFKLTSDAGSNFKDMSSSMSSFSSVKKIVQAKITTGFSDNTFRPNDTLTRGQISAFLARAMGYNNVKVIYSTKEIVDLNDNKIVLINTDIGQGSGIVVSNGLILTNHHVIDGATNATVTFNNGEQYVVNGVIEFDALKDIALLKTTKKFNISGVTIRPSSKGLSKGEKVVAIGSPIGLQNTVSEGIISSFRLYNNVSLIQTNADIDHGSSGGAMFDVTGQLIGMTSSGYDDVSANLNFAVATEEFVPMVNKYINKDFNSIYASFPIPHTPNSPPVFGDISFGMTKKQIVGLSDGVFKRETTNNLYFSNVNVLGELAEVSYEFVGDQLEAINVYHYSVDNQRDFSILEDFFIIMYNEIYLIEGREIFLDTDWYDDGDSYQLSAYWVTANYNTLLTVVVKANDAYGGIRLSWIK